MISLQKRYKVKTGASSGFRQVGSVTTEAAADRWLLKHGSEDIRAVEVRCGCIAYSSGNWERCADHAHLG